jgi:predicted ATPase
LKTKRIVITGGPGSGKTSLIQYFETKGHFCLPEISRDVIRKAQHEGIDQLFLEDPLRFSQLLLEGRMEQYHLASSFKGSFLFYDRGIPDIMAYMDYLHTPYPSHFNESCQQYLYDAVFLLPPWEEIYRQDNERYESYAEAEKIFQFLHRGYEHCGYKVHHVPVGTIEYRSAHILEKLKELF